jgi:hypothetical protein
MPPLQQPSEDNLPFDISLAKASLAQLQEQEELIKTARDAAYRDAYHATKKTGTAQCNICGNRFKINELVGRTWLAAVWKQKKEVVRQEGTFQTWKTTESTTPIEPALPISVWFCKGCFWQSLHKKTRTIDARLTAVFSTIILLLPLAFVGTPAFYYFLAVSALLVLFLIVLTVKMNPRRRLGSFYRYCKKRAAKKNAPFYPMDDLELLKSNLEGELRVKLKTLGPEHFAKDRNVILKSYVGIPRTEDDRVPEWLINELEQIDSKPEFNSKHPFHC